jgi:D-sedoheptulose 7-phosphate isomerase
MNQESVDMPLEQYRDYSRRLTNVLTHFDWTPVARLSGVLRACWREERQFFLCGNGGSAANAIHLANDYLYGIDKASGRGLRVTALPSNAAVLTCLANDVAYEQIFSAQLKVLARAGDVLLVLSGSGNSTNVVEALKTGRALGLRTAAILGYSGGRCKELAEIPIHFAIDDMQIAEDLQMNVGHMLMQELSRAGSGRKA